MEQKPFAELHAFVCGKQEKSECYANQDTCARFDRAGYTADLQDVNRLYLANVRLPWTE